MRQRPDIEIGDLVEVVSKKLYNGLQYKVTKLVGSKMVVGLITKPVATKPAYIVGHTIQLFAERLRVIEREDKKFKHVKIFAKEGGWGP